MCIRYPCCLLLSLAANPWQACLTLTTHCADGELAQPGAPYAVTWAMEQPVQHVHRLELSSCVLETNLPGLEATVRRTPEVDESEVWVPSAGPFGL